MWCVTFELNVLSIGKKLERTPDNNTFFSLQCELWPYLYMTLHRYVYRNVMPVLFLKIVNVWTKLWGVALYIMLGILV